jgi:DNA modification methylase
MKLDVIYNEDCYEGIKNIPDKSIDLVYIDIPYLFADGGCSSSPLSARIKKLKQVDLADITKGIDYSIYDEIIRILKKINCFIWCSKEQILDTLNYFVNKGCMFEILTWNKTNPTPMTNNTFLPDIEYCLYFREKGVPLNDGYELKSKWYISPINKNDKDLFNHPTIKPLELVKRHIKHTTQENDIVLDCFMGSGTTAVACKELGRHYIGFEVNPKYYQIAIDRVNGLTVADRKKKEAGQLSLFDIE